MIKLMINFLIIYILLKTFIEIKFLSFSFVRKNISAKKKFSKKGPRNLNEFYFSQKTEKISKLLFINSCLIKSVVLFKVLKNHGFNPELCIAVSKKDESLSSHAWVESNGKLINEDNSNILNYRVIERIF
tara:strand:- start:35637 stop:36026 length:390 start_codon:yes stop_codon:yes gene_type:complete